MDHYVDLISFMFDDVLAEANYEGYLLSDFTDFWATLYTDIESEIYYDATEDFEFMEGVSSYSGGSGTEDDPYQIATAADLIELGNDPCNYDKYFILTADIDLSGYSFNRPVIAAMKMIRCPIFRARIFLALLTVRATISVI